MWTVKDYRTNFDELKESIRQKSFIFVKFNGVRAGLIRVTKLDDDTGVLGMLAVEPQFQGNKLGSKLMQAAEDWSKD